VVTFGDKRARAKRRLAAALRWGGSVVAVGALVALGGVSTPGPAQADSTPSGYDQMSGSGNTPSFVTVPWTSGLRDASNQPITNPGSELNPNVDRQNDTGPYTFMDDGVQCQSSNCPDGNGYGAFKTLTVTVSQTQDLGHGGITVSWTGAEPTVDNQGALAGGYLQMMECYGNASTGPSPEDCEFGASPVPGGMPTAAARRHGALCATDTLSTTNPPNAVNGPPGAGCDPWEPGTEAPTHYPCATVNGQVPTPNPNPDCVPGDYSIPFVPDDGAEPALYDNQNELGEAFDSTSTNEVNFATTDSAGDGQQQFETLTSAQSSGLGCGQEQSNNTPQGCWLVIVPRGIYEPNGFDTSAGGTKVAIADQSSPLSAGNWAQRIQVHLSYAQLATFCPLGGTGRESLMEGSQLVSRAVESWEVKLNQAANCTLIYHEAETPEQVVTTDFSDPVTPGVPNNGLAFTTAPVGDDRLRNGESPPALPTIVYAPVAVMALDFGFHIDESSSGNNPALQSGYLSTAVKLSPQLVARAVTQSYYWDLTDYAPSLTNNGVHPYLQAPWAAHNPANISQDPQFTQLNPEVIGEGISAAAPLDTIDHSAYYQQIWQWLEADSTTSSWLDGVSNSSNSAVTIDPSYESQQLGTPPAIDSMPRSYPCSSLTFQPSPGQPITQSLCSTDINPYVADFDAASADVLLGSSLGYHQTWDTNLATPTGQPTGYWDKAALGGPGNTWMWALDATPYTAAYGLVPAQLCDDSGGNCISPTVASVTAAVNDAKPDSAGLLQVNPASPGAGAYPLTEVIYAAVRTDMPAQALTDYANFISYAVNQGQTAGQAPGDLPAGYLPLPASLQAQANAVVTRLTQIAGGGSTSSATPSASNSSSSSSAAGAATTSAANGNTNSNTNSNTGSNSGTQPSATPNSAASTSASNGTPATSAASSSLSSCPTPTTAISVTASTAPPAVTPTCASATGPVIAPPTVQLAAGTTPGQPVGPIRDVLAVVLIVGVAGAGGGIMLRHGRLPRWPGRGP
jgi:hypothetical protein